MREGAEFRFEVPATIPDPKTAEIIAQDLVKAKLDLSKAETEAAKYSGGLMQIMALNTVVTQKQTVALLTQRALIALHGLPYPDFKGDAKAFGSIESVSKASSDLATKTPEAPPIPELSSFEKCLEIGEYGSSLLAKNTVYVKVAWKVDVKNHCGQQFSIRVRFVLRDKDDYEVDYDTERINVPANGTGKARGDMLVSPPSLYERAEYIGVSISWR